MKKVKVKFCSTSALCFSHKWGHCGSMDHGNFAVTSSIIEIWENNDSHTMMYKKLKKPKLLVFYVIDLKRHNDHSFWENIWLNYLFKLSVPSTSNYTFYLKWSRWCLTGQGRVIWGQCVCQASFWNRPFSSTRVLFFCDYGCCTVTLHFFLPQVKLL